MAEKDVDAGPSNNLEESLEESLGLASQAFDPMRVLYAPSLGYADEDVETYSSVSQFMKNLSEIPSPNCENSSASLEDSPTDFTSTVSRSLAVLDAELSTPDVEKESDNNMTVKTDTGLVPDQTSLLFQITDKSDIDKVQVEHSEKSDEKNCETIALADEPGSPTDKPEKPTPSHRKRTPRRTVLTEMETGFEHGPLSILKRSVREKLKVRVWTRSVRNIRGICTGYVVAFDKHMNLAMMDVDEIYRKPLGKHQKKSKKPKVKAVPKEDSPRSDETDAAQPCYPKTPWQRFSPGTAGGDSVMGGSGAPDPDGSNDEDSGDHSNGHSETSPPADGIGDLPSAFGGMHVFEESKASRLLGAKSRKVLSRHFNQVLLRGDHVVAVALDE